MTTIFEDNNNNTVMTIPKITVIEMVIVAMIDRYKIEIVEHSYNEGTYRNVKMITVMKTCVQGMMHYPLHFHEIDDIECYFKDNIVHAGDKKAHNNDGDNTS